MWVTWYPDDALLQYVTVFLLRLCHLHQATNMRMSSVRKSTFCCPVDFVCCFCVFAFPDDLHSRVWCGAEANVQPPSAEKPFWKNERDSFLYLLTCFNTPAAYFYSSVAAKASSFPRGSFQWFQSSCCALRTRQI